MNNQEIRRACKVHGVKLWEVAEALGITDASFSRKMRRELPDDEREKVLAIIQKLAADGQESSNADH